MKNSEHIHERMVNRLDSLGSVILSDLDADFNHPNRLLRGFGYVGALAGALLVANNFREFDPHTLTIGIGGGISSLGLVYMHSDRTTQPPHREPLTPHNQSFSAGNNK